MHEARSIGTGAENSEFQSLSELFDNCAANVLELAQQEELQFTDPVREYALYVSALSSLSSDCLSKHFDALRTAGTRTL